MRNSSDDSTSISFLCGRVFVVCLALMKLSQEFPTWVVIGCGVPRVVAWIAGDSPHTHFRRSSCKAYVFLLDPNEDRNMSTNFSETCQYHTS
jgi:hypothetical protein